jgi:hypothetical protein
MKNLWYGGFGVQMPFLKSEVSGHHAAKFALVFKNGDAWGVDVRGHGMALF